jgi:hypothetical protein
MASSGTITQSIRTGYQLKIAWSVGSQSVANNTSSVTVKVQLVSTGSSYTINSSASKSGSVTINGTKYSFTFSAALSGNQTKTLYAKTVTVSHNADGTKTCSFATTCGINVTLGGTYYGNVTASGSGTFDTIARASTISSVTASVAINGSNAVTVSITRASSSFTHTVVFSFGSYSKTVTGVGTSTSYAIPTSWMNAMPSATSGTAKVTVTTYSGSTKIGTAVSKNFTVTVPSSVVPTISSVTMAEAVSGLSAKFGAYVQNKSKIAVKITAAGAYSSTIKSYKTTIQGASFTAASFTSGTLTKSGTSTATITVTDSRGRTASTTRSITVVAYASPKITAFQGFRCLADGTENYDGTYLNSKLSFAISSVGSKNDKSYTLSYRPKNTEAWSDLTIGSVYAHSGNIVSASGILGIDKSFDVRLTVTDYFSTVQSVIEIPTSFTLLDFNASGRGIAFGKVSEVDGMEVDLDMSIYRNVYMGGSKRSDDEKNMYFQASETAANPHNCKLYGGNGASATSIGCWDSARSIGIWRYLSGTKNMVIDGNVSLTHGNGGNAFVTSGAVTHGSRSGRVQFSNGLLLQWDTESITPAANTPTKKTVTFPIAYTDTPVVITTAQTAVPGTSVTGTAAASITATGFDCYVTRTGTTATSVGWLSIGYKG